MRSKIAMAALLGIMHITQGFAQGAENPIYEGNYARQLVIKYEIGKSNDVVGILKNPTNQTLDVTLEFKGYDVDGMVSQGGAIVIIEHLGPGESAKFSGAGFFAYVKRVLPVRIRTTP